MNHAHAPTSSFSRGAPAPVVATQSKRFGLVKMRIGSNHMIRGKEGRRAQFEVRERARFKGASIVHICLNPLCAGKTFKNLDDVIAQHPEHEVMEKNEEAHVIGMWSEALMLRDPPHTVLDAKEIEKLKTSGVDLDSATTVVGLLGDER